MINKTFEIDGFVYDTIKVAYEDIEPPTSYATFKRRLKDGATYDELMLPSKTSSRSIPVVINGVYYSNLREAHKKLGIAFSLNKFYKRYRQGFRDDELIQSEPIDTQRVVIDGLIYKNKKQAYKMINPPVPFQKFSNAISYGHTGLQAILKSIRPVIIVDGKSYNSYIQAYKDLTIDIPLKTFKKHYYEGITSEKLLELISNPKPRKTAKKINHNIVINGIEYTSFNKAYDALKPPTSCSTFRRRYERGCSFDEIMSVATNISPEYIVDGVVFKNAQSAFNALKPKCGYALFKSRLITGVRGEELTSEATWKQYEIVINDKRYNNISQAYDELKPNCSLTTFRRRLQSGKSVEHLLNKG